jgi:imidazolonepropionase-like amidohydrolase
MRAAGVNLVASTDAGIPNVKHEDLGKALPIFAHMAALTPLDALKTATSNAAVAIGLRGVTGQLAIGQAADVLFVDGDPLTDLSCLATPAGVLARGAPAL